MPSSRRAVECSRPNANHKHPRFFHRGLKLASADCGNCAVACGSFHLDVNEYLRIKDLSHASGLSRSAVHAAIVRQEIPARRYGRAILIRGEDAARWLEGFAQYEPRRRQLHGLAGGKR